MRPNLILIGVWWHVATLTLGCTCGPEGASDAGTSIDAARDGGWDAPSIDATVEPPDGGLDANAPDAWVPDRLILREVDTTPCPPLEAQAHRPRALPADPTPRVLWVRSYAELGIEGHTYNAGSVDRAGHLTFDALLLDSAVYEVSAAGALRGVGTRFLRIKGYYGPTMSLVDGRSAGFVLDMIRLDADPPQPEATREVSFRSLSTDGVDLQGLAATSDGGFYAQRMSHSALRKYCGDGRLQWELLGVERAEGMMVEADDSVWLPGASRSTGYAPTRIDVLGRELERVPLPSGSELVAGATMQIAGPTMLVASASAESGANIISVQEGGAEVWRLERRSGIFRLTPHGSVWALDETSGEGRWGLYDRRGGVVVADSSLPLDIRGPMGDDGSLLTEVSVGGVGGRHVGRTLTDGSIAWVVSIEHPFVYMTHDVDGRLYLYGGGHVIAIQTDVLPPGIRGCWQVGCSPRADGRIEPLP